jgi:hypothetical protein
MWYSGSAVMITSSPSRMLLPHHAEDCSRLETMLPWVSIAPLDTPVVPPVYCRNAMSSCPSVGSSSGLPCPSESALAHGTAPGRLKSGTIFFTRFTTKLVIAPFGKPSMSPMRVVTTVLTGVLSSTASSVLAKFSRITIATAPESLSWCSSSRGV